MRERPPGYQHKPTASWRLVPATALGLLAFSLGLLGVLFLRTGSRRIRLRESQREATEPLLKAVPGKRSLPGSESPDRRRGMRQVLASGTVQGFGALSSILSLLFFLLSMYWPAQVADPAGPTESVAAKVMEDAAGPTDEVAIVLGTAVEAVNPDLQVSRIVTTDSKVAQAFAQVLALESGGPRPEILQTDYETVARLARGDAREVPEGYRPLKPTQAYLVVAPSWKERNIGSDRIRTVFLEADFHLLGSDGPVPVFQSASAHTGAGESLETALMQAAERSLWDVKRFLSSRRGMA